VIAIENVRLFNELERRNRDLTATSEILRVISSSPTDVQPVFDAIAHSAARLCEAFDAIVLRVDGDILRLAAHHGPMPAGDVPLHRGTVGGRTVMERRVIHLDDIQAEANEFPEGSAMARPRGHRTTLSVPLVRENVAIGNIQIRRNEVRPFSDKHVRLLQTFADQAVIAIENVRLFTELEARNRDLTESLEQQTATAEILRVISSSPTDIQPVLDTLVRSAVRFCIADDAMIQRLEGDGLLPVAHHGPIPARLGYVLSLVGTSTGRSVLERQPVHVADLQVEREAFPEGSAIARERGFHTSLSVPLLREGVPLGAILLRRTRVERFSDKQVALLQTFADQAVIAIENVRLFTELQEKNRALTEAHAQVTESLEQQTATGEILRVIASSPTDLQPVFDAIVRSAVGLCDGLHSNVYRVEDDRIHLVAHHNFPPTAVEEFQRGEPPPVRKAEGLAARAIRERMVLHVRDVETDLGIPEHTRRRARAVGARSLLYVPMLRGEAAIGAIVVSRSEVRPFSTRQIQLIQAFAVQAVIAIENVRLFTEVQARTRELSRSVEELKALGEVGQTVSSTLDLQTVLSTIVGRAVELSGTDGGAIYEFDEGTEEFHLRATHGMSLELIEAVREARIRLGETAVGRAALNREAVQIPDIMAEAAYSLRDVMERAGFRAFLAVPLLRESRIIGALVVRRRVPGPFSKETVDLLKTFATQSALAIQNARLFREIADKSRLLEAASRHKSEFLANMSHELRTPLNAILGFSEVLAERMFGEVNEKQAEYLQDILASGRHLLSLINDILDLSKVEAGRLELELGQFHLPTALDNALTLVRERATRHGITLTHSVDPGLADIVADERKVKQILLNLLSNAVKFTPEGGRVGLTATAADRVVTIAVSDTGVGIAPEDQAAIFEEFRQVGRDDTRKQEGTGLGLTLAKKFVELHGGRIWVESQVGQGSTFNFTLPLRLDETGARDHAAGVLLRP
jgi:signal transduction histidine kinase